jgi:acyl-CoA synthetase (AMP-forming)/AMP-acid ligase II
MLLTQRQFLTTATYIANHNALSYSDVGLNPLPLWHINAEVVAATATAVAGAQLILQRRFKRTDFWSLVNEHRVTWINAVPAIVSHLATLRDGERVPASVRFIRSASAPLPAELITQFERDIGVPVIESYGMTEAASQICANPLVGTRKPGSVGVPVGVELRVEPLPDEVVDVSSSQPNVGQIALRGPSIITSYASDDYASRFTDDGWLLTGDLGYVDEDGYVFLVGRSDDVINRSGEKIYPREIEEIILQVEGVSAVSVIGVPDVILGSVPLAYIEVGDGGDDESTCQRVAVVLEGALGRSKRPTAIRVVDALPRHATGKIQKNPLREGAVAIRFEALLS